MAAIDCCTREIVAWHLESRCRATEAITLIERAAAERAITPGTPTRGTDNGSAFTARAFKAVLSGLRIAHRRGGYRDPESQAFIESWFGKLKQRCVWRHEFETLDEAREVIGSYVIHYHDRPHSRLDYRTPLEVAATWNDGGQTHLIPAARTVNAAGEHVMTACRRGRSLAGPVARFRAQLSAGLGATS